MSLSILLIGSGGREHALTWKLAQSNLVNHIYVCPGNAGTIREPKVSNVDSISPADFPALVAFAQKHEVNLVVPGPEQPLVDGIEDWFRKVGIPVFGPSKPAARMEGSKAFSKAFMQRHNIPTAQFRVFTPDQINDAVNYIKTCGFEVVLKASGLAAGKGVIIPQSLDEAVEAAHEILIGSKFGDAGNELVIEELLSGPEVSVLAFSDGYTVTPLPAAQDHKRIGDGDVGLNTGGMGAYVPAPIATPAILDQIMRESLKPTIDGMRKEGFPFMGLLFTGFMLTSNGPKVLEYNVRFGDPETEAIIMLLSSDCDLAAILLACVKHHLDSVEVKTRPGFAVSVVLASEGYPGSYPTGREILLGDLAPDVVVFHAGTASSKDGSGVLTAGGRVLAVSGYATTLQEALNNTYASIQNVMFDGQVFRRDIAYRALNTSPVHDALTYAQAGVSVDAGNALVDAIKPYVRATRRPGADAEIGGFGGVFDLKSLSSGSGGFAYTDPVLVSGTDGVGTKLRVAVDVGIHDLVGIDLVAMSVNDLLVQGAEPLYFLDYFGCSKLDVPVASQVIKGIAEGCRQANCALIGGETAEMPGMYQKDDYDLAGFAVGAVERSLILPQPTIQVGDVLIGIASSGLHSNGFSLVRKVIERSGLSYSSPCPWDTAQTLGRFLLEPTRIYIQQVLPVAQSNLLKGMSHITGGGFLENIPRVLPKHLGCVVDASTWTLPPVFKFIQRQGVAPLEMARTFNNGIGMVLIVSPENVEPVLAKLQQSNTAEAWRIGQVTNTPGVEMQNLHLWKQDA